MDSIKFPADAGFICYRVPTTATLLRAKIKDKLCDYPPELTSPVLKHFIVQLTHTTLKT
jgi:hypothetical protein